MRWCRSFLWLTINVFDMHGISVAESIVSWCSILSLSRTPVCGSLWMRIESSKRKHRVQPIICCHRCLLYVATAVHERFGVSTSGNVLLPPPLASTVTVLVPSVHTGVTTGHWGCFVVTAAVVLTVAIDPKRSGMHRPGLRQDSVPIFASRLANRHS